MGRLRCEYQVTSIPRSSNVFHHNADAAALGLFQAIREHPGTWIFGANADQAPLVPGQVVASAVIDLPRAILAVAREVHDGAFVPRVESFGLASGVIRFEVNPAEIRGTRKFNQHKKGEELAATIEGQRGAGREDIVAAIQEAIAKDE